MGVEEEGGGALKTFDRGLVHVSKWRSLWAGGGGCKHPPQ